ncbi:hypothetical protein ACEWY4_010749 [Coilia grayii]|uniref:Link domain-containing protein n=1 Tax=Coilia grayii TaxID=363190 RepID=A0ABD1K2T3_9TELE
MSRHRSTSCLLWFCGVFCVLALDLPQDQVATSRTVSGVFMVMLNNMYSFNASVSSGVCRALHAEIATKAQVETALNNGLEMCRFGWVEEKIAVVPRIKPSEKCGNSKTGLVVWRATEKQLFDVFCFNNTDSLTTPRATTVSTRTTARQERLTSPPPPAKFPPLLITSPQPKRPSLTTSTKPHSSLSPSIPPPFSSKEPRTTSATTTTRPPSSSHPVHPSSPSLYPPEQSSVLASFPSNHTLSSKRGESAGIAVLITVVLVLAILAVLAVYYKKKEGGLLFRRQGQQKGAVETEMFKHFRESDLKRRHSGGDGERSRKCSSDITLLMEQEAKAEMA